MSELETRDKTFKIVRQVAVTEETLEKIAELLGIPAAERGQLISGTIYIGTSPPQPGGSARPSARSRAARPSATSGRRRQRQ